MSQWVYSVGAGRADGRAEMRNLLGGKGANLAEMSNLGLPVPPGFTISTEVCTFYYANERTYPKDLAEQVANGLAFVAKVTGRMPDPMHLTLSLPGGGTLEVAFQQAGPA